MTAATHSWWTGSRCAAVCSRGAVGVLAMLASGLAGCFAAPPSDSPVAGIWEFTTTANTQTSLQFLFELDLNGNVVWTLYKVGTNPTVVDNSPSGRASVSGGSVSMNFSFGDSFYNTFTFTGNYDESQRRMTGRTTLRVIEGGTSVNLQSAPSTLSDATETPPADAELEGTWEYFPDGTDGPDVTGLEQLLLTFDESNVPTRVIYKTTDNTTVIDNAPSGSTSVVGQTVTFDITFLNGAAIFTGAFETDGSLTGDLTVLIRDRGTIVSIDSAASILAPLDE